MIVKQKCNDILNYVFSFIWLKCMNMNLINVHNFGFSKSENKCEMWNFICEINMADFDNNNIVFMTWFVMWFRISSEKKQTCLTKKRWAKSIWEYINCFSALSSIYANFNCYFVFSSAIILETSEVN